MSGSLQWQLMRCEYLISSGFQALFRVSEGVIWGDFKAATSLGQSPLATSSGVGHKWVGYATAESRCHQIWLRL